MELSGWSIEESNPCSFPGHFPRVFLPPSDLPQVQGLSKMHLCLGCLERAGGWVPLAPVQSPSGVSVLDVRSLNLWGVVKQMSCLPCPGRCLSSVLEHSSIPLAPLTAFWGHVASASLSSGRKASVLSVMAHLPGPLPNSLARVFLSPLPGETPG